MLLNAAQAEADRREGPVGEAAAASVGEEADRQAGENARQAEAELAASRSHSSGAVTLCIYPAIVRAGLCQLNASTFTVAHHRQELMCCGLKDAPIVIMGKKSSAQAKT